jgi:RHS repeat-associated protein
MIADTPVGYAPAIGPSPQFEVRYNSRELLLPQIFSFSNFGPRWAFDWLSYAEERPASCGVINNGCVPDHVYVFLRGGGGEPYLGPPDMNGAYPTHYRARATLVKTSTSPIRYERRLADGGVHVFGQADGAPAGQRRVFLTEIRDPQGHTLQFTYDSQLRLAALTDALGQVTTLSYEVGSDPLKVTKVTDPFGRFASFGYNASGRLESITDVIGMTSSFVYGPDDNIVSMTTPYGTTTFRYEADALGFYTSPMVEATDPLGGTERLEFHWQSALPSSEPANAVPTGFTAANTDLDKYVTLYWDKRAWMLYPGDASKALQTHWLLHGEYPGIDIVRSVPVPHSVKRPLENRVWYAYPNQPSADYAGTHTTSSNIARVLDDGTTQSLQATYNTMGQMTSTTDPMGRRTSYTYAANGIDLIEVRQTTGTLNDLLATYANYTTQHLPQTITDAAGQTTTLTYNSAGQVTTSTNPKNETTTSVYETGTGRLLSITGPVTGATTTYTYDGYGRVRTVTDSDGYALTTDYDAMDRPIRVTYPDETYDETTYERLNVATRRDRLGRVTRMFFDALGRLVSTRDPLGRVITQEWCACGAMEALVDANGSRTAWERDAQQRVVKEVRANGSETLYVYETTTSRLKRQTDPRGQHTDYIYFADNQPQQTSYPNAVIATPTVTFTYDTTYGRVSTMVDGTGTTTTTYHAPGNFGAGQVASIDGPLTNDTIAYAYDQLGRVTTRSINGSANEVTWTFDALGRVTAETNVLGTFAYGYDGHTNRVASVTYPNNQTSTYAYFGNTGDHRLQTIHHKYPNTTTLSKFDYTYDAAENILTWRQQADTTAVLWNYGYDLADQLTLAVKQLTDPTPVVLKRYGYTYDPAGNRTAEQIDDAVTGATYDNMNRLVSRQPGGVLRFVGTVNEASTVRIDGRPATVTPDGRFAGQVPVGGGASTVTIVATDPSGNSATAVYDLTQSGAAQTSAYDANGNLTSDGIHTYEWNARNQLAAIDGGTSRSEFTYDGLRRRVRVVEKENGTVQLETTVVWCEEEICEVRAADGIVVTKRAFLFGEQQSGDARLFVSDHLGSVTEVTDSSSTLLARYDLDPWGRRTLVAGNDVTERGYTDLTTHPPSGLNIALYRVYSPSLGRWTSADPAGMQDGLNLYQYVANNPLKYVDPLGLSKRKRRTQSRTRLCNEKETIACEIQCANKGVESCRVSQTFRVTRATGGLVGWEWKDGPMSCSCKEPKEPVCKNCRVVLEWIVILGTIAVQTARTCVQLAPAS